MWHSPRSPWWISPVRCRVDKSSPSKFLQHSNDNLSEHANILQLSNQRCPVPHHLPQPARLNSAHQWLTGAPSGHSILTAAASMICEKLGILFKFCQAPSQHLQPGPS